MYHPPEILDPAVTPDPRGVPVRAARWGVGWAGVQSREGPGPCRQQGSQGSRLAPSRMLGEARSLDHGSAPGASTTAKSTGPRQRHLALGGAAWVVSATIYSVEKAKMARSSASLRAGPLQSRSCEGGLGHALGSA